MLSGTFHRAEPSNHECPNHNHWCSWHLCYVSFGGHQKSLLEARTQQNGGIAPTIDSVHRAIKIILLCSACDIVILVALLLLQLNYYSMEAEFTTQKLVFSKTNFAASNVVSLQHSRLWMAGGVHINQVKGIHS